MSAITSLWLSSLVFAQQVTLPPVTVGTTDSLSYRTPSEFAFSLRVSRLRQREDDRLAAPRDTRDSLDRAVANRAQAWMRGKPIASAPGLELDPYGAVFAQAGQIEMAKQQFERRLATPHLSIADQSYTYMTAIQAFATVEHPERIPEAERYMRKLDALGSEAAVWRYRAHRVLADVHYMLGHRTDALRHGRQALTIVSSMPFIDRREVYTTPETYLMVVDLLAIMPNGRAILDSIHTVMSAALRLEPTLAATIREGESQTYARMYRDLVALGAMIGKPAPPIQANRWINMAIPQSPTPRMDDGVIRVIAFGDFTWRPTLEALLGLQRVATRFANGVQVMYVTRLTGYWGTAFVSPQDEVDRLGEFYTDSLHITFPIALWVNEKQPTRDGGLLPGPNPNFEVYHVRGGPYVCIVDGSGVIRRIFLEFGRETERRAVAVIQSLLGTQYHAAS